MSSNRHDQDVEHLMSELDVDFPYYNLYSSNQRLVIGKTQPVRHDRKNDETLEESSRHESEQFVASYTVQRASSNLKMSDVFHLLLEQR